MSEVYCVHCRDEREIRIEKRNEEFDVKGEATAIESEVAVCVNCGEAIFVEEVDEKNLKKAYDAYRANHKMMTAREIREIREEYMLSQAELAELLSWGRVTINRYENGAIQSRGHDQTLKLLKNPENVRQLLEQADATLSEDLKLKLTAQLENLGNTHETHSLSACITALLDSGEPSIINGFRRFDLEITHQAATFLASNVKHYFKSKATKLLWYADFLAFKSQARSITGCAYVAANLGPVPRRFELLFNEMVEIGIFDIEGVPFPTEDGGSFIGGLYQPLVEPTTNRLSGIELQCLQAIAAEFGELSSNKTIDRAHEEEAYKSVFEKGKPWKTIPYDLAETLSLEAISE